jgi:alpha/beta superfamily hydrolase
LLWLLSREAVINRKPMRDYGRGELRSDRTRYCADIARAHPPTEKHMLLYKFGAGVGTRVVLTKDKTGSTLPADGRPWKALGTARVDTSTSVIGADCADIIAALEKQGFFVFPTSQTKPSAA